MMRPTLMPWVVLIAVLSMTMTSARAETPDEWIALGARVHGGFGSFIPLGIRIGLDALQRLDAKPRDVTVVYYDNDKAPCACVADGVAIATLASVGQRTLQIAAEKAPPNMMAVVVIRHKHTNEATQIFGPRQTASSVGRMEQDVGCRGRYEQVMKEQGLYDVRAIK